MKYVSYRWGTAQHIAVLAALFLGVIPLVSCSKEAPTREEMTEATQAVTAPTQFTFSLPPSGSPGSVAVSGSLGVKLDDRAHVVENSTQYAVVAGLGSEGVQLGVEASSGDIWSKGVVALADRSTVHGAITTTATISPGNSVTIDGTQSQNATITPTVISRTVTFPSEITTLPPIQPDQTPPPLAPGAYDSISIGSRSTLNLSSGTYYINSLDVEPQATLRFDKSNGPVYLYVRNSLIYRGSMSDANGGSDANVLVGYFGTNEVFLEAPFVGTFVAPNGKLHLKTVGSAGHTGAFFGQRVEIDPDVTVHHHAFSWMIQNVVLDKTSVCPGESMNVNVVANDAANNTATKIGINGTPGNPAFVQFTGPPGPRYISIDVASSNGFVDSRLVQIQVKDCGSALVNPTFVYRPIVFHSNTVEFNITNVTQLGASGITYLWDFGDGQTGSSSDPFVWHDYSNSLANGSDYSNFTVTLTAVQTGVANRIVKRTLAVWNLYSMNKHRGYIVPPVTAPTNVSASGDNWVANYTVKNLENAAITLTQAATEFRFCEPTSSPQRTAWQAQAVTINGQASSSLQLSMAKSQMPAGVCEIAVHWLGTSSQSLPVNAHAYFAVPGSRKSVPITDAAFNAAFTQLAKSGVIPDPDNVTGEQIYLLVRQGKLPQPKLPASSFDRCSASQLEATGLKGFFRSGSLWAGVLAA